MKFGEVVNFKTDNIVYDAISGHPDIFFHKVDNTIIFAPNTPQRYIEILKTTSLTLIKGEKALGFRYPETIFYNAVASQKKLYCHSKFIDKSLINAHASKEIVHLNQGYAACNMVVGPQLILASDKGICNITEAQYFNPSEIQLEGVKNGFIGGSCVVFMDKLLLFGSMKHISQSSIIEMFAKENKLNIIELYSGPLVDGGGLLWVIG